MKIDHTETATPALAPPRIGPLNFAKAARARYHRACLRIPHQRRLQSQIVFVCDKVLAHYVGEVERLHERHAHVRTFAMVTALSYHLSAAISSYSIGTVNTPDQYLTT